MMQFHLFLPQMRMTFDELVERGQAAEQAGFDGVAFMDHLAPPLAPEHPMFEAMTTATWVAAKTSQLRVGHLVLCDGFRHPALLAQAAASLDHASGGRFELGIGWGSVPEELEAFGFGVTAARARVERLGESLEVIRGLWRGEKVDFAGAHHRITGGQQRPQPGSPGIPIVIGGAGPRTMELVARHADWWNLPVYAIDRLAELREQAGSARVSAQLLVTLVPDEQRRDEVVAAAERRFGFIQPAARLVGTPPELVEQLHALAGRGIERIYTWFSDFAPPESLAQFGAEVIAPLAPQP
jgi:alkanesulfonate monooxygenase SsuD/methylene tetrahydromethanopterin reductase-like flavin-dependent oxidoreductase (luciferase family)